MRFLTVIAALLALVTASAAQAPNQQPTVPAAQAPAADINSLDDDAVWNAIANTSDIAAIQAFLARFPNSSHAPAARERLARARRDVEIAVLRKVADAAQAEERRLSDEVDDLSSKREEMQKSLARLREQNAPNEDIARLEAQIADLDSALGERRRAYLEAERRFIDIAIKLQNAQAGGGDSGEAQTRNSGGAPATFVRPIAQLRAFDSARLAMHALTLATLALLGAGLVLYGRRRASLALRAGGALVMLLGIPVTLAWALHSVVRGGSLELHRHLAAIVHLAVSADGRYVATADTAGRVTIANLAAGSFEIARDTVAGPTAPENLSRRRPLGFIRGLTFVASGQPAPSEQDGRQWQLAVTGDHVEFYRSDDGAHVRNEYPAEIPKDSMVHLTNCLPQSREVAASLTDERIAIDSTGGVLRLLCTGAANCVFSHLRRESDRFLCGPQRRWTAIVPVSPSTYALGRPDGRIDLFTSAATVDFPDPPLADGHRGPVRALAAAGNTLVSIGSADGLILWRETSSANWSRMPLEAGPASVASFAISPSGRHVIASDHEGRAVLWDTQSPGVSSGAGTAVRAFGLRHDQPAPLAALNGSGPNRFNRADDRSPSRIAAVAVSDDLAVTGGDDGLIRAWDIASGASSGAIRGHRDGITHLALLPGGRIVSASMDGAVRLSDVPVSAALAAVDPNAIYESATQVASGMGRRVWRATVQRVAGWWQPSPSSDVSAFDLWALIDTPNPRLAGTGPGNRAYEIVAKSVRRSPDNAEAVELTEARFRFELDDKSSVQVTAGSVVVHQPGGKWGRFDLSDDVILRVGNVFQARFGNVTFDVEQYVVTANDTAVMVRFANGEVISGGLLFDIKTGEGRLASGVRANFANVALVAAGGTALAAESQGAPDRLGALAGLLRDRTRPMAIEASGAVISQRDRMVRLENVRLVQGGVVMQARTMNMFYGDSDDPQSAMVLGAGIAGGIPIQRIVAIDNVSIAYDGATAQSFRAAFDLDTNVVTLDGDVVLTRGQDVRRGQRLTVDFKSGTVQIAEDAQQSRP